MSTYSGLLGLIFTKPQSKIEDPAKLRRLIQLIDEETWCRLDFDVQGEIYEGLLARNAQDVRGGAGQYFTPRPIIRAIVNVMRPRPTMRITDPACGTGGFLLATHDYLRSNFRFASAKLRRFVDQEAITGNDLVANVARLCGMNLFLHGMGEGTKVLVRISDSLAKKSPPVDMVLTNPPFGKKSSFTVIHDDGRRDIEKIYYERNDFWTTTSNKQLNFVQNVYTMLVEGGRAAIVIPDNVLFEGGAGEQIRRALLQHCDVHTLLRLPIGIWYSAGVKANVLFFDRKSKSKKPSTKELWVYDLRTNKNFTLRQKPISDGDLAEFVKLFSAVNRSKNRKEANRFRRYTYDELMSRERVNFDIFWLEEEAGNNSIKADDLGVLAAEIADDLRKALIEFTAVEAELQ